MKKYPVEVVLSITTGRLLCAFGELHECCEFLVGGPIFTHQFAHRPFTEELKDGILLQHPQLRDADVSSCDTSNWQTVRDAMIARFGKKLTLSPFQATKLSESFSVPLKGKQVIGVVTD